MTLYKDKGGVLEGPRGSVLKTSPLYKRILRRVQEGEDTIEVVETSLSETKQDATDRVNRTAEAIRATYITNTGIGQGLTYQRKAEEGRKYLTETDKGNTPDPTDYPYVHQRATDMGMTPIQAANQFLQKDREWEAIGVKIEHEREVGKMNIRNAGDEAAVQSAADTTIQDLGALRNPEEE